MCGFVIMVRNMNLFLSGEGIKGFWVGIWYDIKVYIKIIFVII